MTSASEGGVRRVFRRSTSSTSQFNSRDRSRPEHSGNRDATSISMPTRGQCDQRSRPAQERSSAAPIPTIGLPGSSFAKFSHRGFRRTFYSPIIAWEGTPIACEFMLRMWPIGPKGPPRSG
jgi:hypothetical protein